MCSGSQHFLITLWSFVNVTKRPFLLCFSLLLNNAFKTSSYTNAIGNCQNIVYNAICQLELPKNHNHFAFILPRVLRTAITTCNTCIALAFHWCIISFWTQMWIMFARAAGTTRHTRSFWETMLCMIPRQIQIGEAKSRTHARTTTKRYSNGIIHGRSPFFCRNHIVWASLVPTPTQIWTSKSERHGTYAVNGHSNGLRWQRCWQRFC